MEGAMAAPLDLQAAMEQFRGSLRGVLQQLLGQETREETSSDEEGR